MNSSIIIPTFQGKEIISCCLDALEQLASEKDRVIIVDNGSTDGTAEFIKNNYPDINLIKLDTNYGFTRAVNEGVKAADSEYVLILNNDCLIEPIDIRKMVDFVVQHELVATQPVIMKRDEIENIGFVVDLRKGKAATVTDSNCQLSIINYQLSNMWKEGYIYGLSATCLLIKRDVFLKEGGFDESFHSYLEDVDLFIRLAMRGYRFAPCLDVSASHKHMATSARMGAYKERHDLTNWIRIILKNYPMTFMIGHFPTLFVERLRNLSGLMKKIVTIYL